MKLPPKEHLLFIFQTGYVLVMYPMGMLTTSTTLYYLLINNVPALKQLFPGGFSDFIIYGATLGIPAILCIGQWFIGSALNKAPTQNNPYSKLLMEQQIPFNDALAKLCRVHGLDAEANTLEELIERSRRVVRG